VTATTPGHDSAERVTSVPEERPTEPFQRISAASGKSSAVAEPAAARRGEEAGAPKTRGRGRAARSRAGEMPNSSPWQRSHAVWHQAGVDWVHTAVTIPTAESPSPQQAGGPAAPPAEGPAEPAAEGSAAPQVDSPAEPAVEGSAAPQADDSAAPPQEQRQAQEEPQQEEREAEQRQTPEAAAERQPPKEPEAPAAAAEPSPVVADPSAQAAPRSRAADKYGARRLALLAGGVAIVLIAGTSGYVALSDGTEGDGPAPSPSGAALADRWFAADPAVRADGLFQELSAVAGDGSTLVAVGGETGGPDRARFLVSTDAGRSWQSAAVRSAAGGEPPPGEVARQVAGGSGRWVALGGPVAPSAGAAQTVVWTSTDALTWTRQETPAVFGPQDKVQALARTSAGFWAVGVSGTGDKAQGALWSSADGISWQRADLSSLGETRALEHVVSSGGTVLVGGTAVEKVTKTERVRGKRRKVTRTVTEQAYWRSPDGGRTWKRIDMPNAKGAYGAYLGPVAGPGGFFVAREAKRPSGSGKRRKNVRQAAVWTSPDGAEWTGAGWLRIPGYAGLEHLAGSPSGLSALVDIGDGKQAVLRGTDGKNWQRAGEVSGVEVGAVAVLAGGPVLAGRRGPDAYLSVPGGEVKLASVPGAVRTERAISALVPDGARLVAVGSSNGEPAAWVSPGGDAWRRASGLGDDPDPQRRRWLTDAVRGENGWVAVGRHDADPLLFTSSDALTWKKGSKPPGGGYAEAVAAAAGGYVAVGRDGRRAVAWYSADRKKWRRAGGTGEGRMRDVAAVPGGYVAVGSRPGPKGDRPAVWTSADGKKWTRVQPGGPPAGIASGALTQVAVGGDVVVALGSGRTGAPEQPYPFIAVSTDRGKTWQTQTLPGGTAGGTVTAVTATPRGLVIAGTTGAPGSRDVVLWTSADGKAWKRRSVHGTGLDGPGDQRLTTLAVVGGELVATGVTGDHRGDTVTFWRTALP